MINFIRIELATLNDFAVFCNVFGGAVSRDRGVDRPVSGEM
jgi:hypothetical protein